MLVTLNHQYQITMGDSLTDVERWLAATPRVPHADNQARSIPPSQSWDLNVGYQGAQDLARHGWSAGAKQIDRSLRAMPAPQGTHAKYQHDVAGYYPDVPAYLEGDPANMIRRGRRTGSRPVLNIVVNGFISAMINAQELVNYGLAMAGVIDILEASGRQVELTMVDCSNRDSGNDRGTVYMQGWNIKRAGDPLDLAALAFTLAHPAAFRRIVFDMMERLPIKAQSYGYPRHMTAKDVAMIGIEDALIIQGVGRNYGVCKTKEAALVYVAHMINQAAGETLVEIEQ